MRHVSESDRLKFPDVEERFGEDPARFLATRMDIIPRIRGIVDLGLCNMYLQVARQLDCSRRVVDAIERRRDFLVDEYQRNGQP